MVMWWRNMDDGNARLNHKSLSMIECDELINGSKMKFQCVGSYLYIEQLVCSKKSIGF